ncbi:MAG: NfeD family protein [Bacillota bacterium]|nr:NfeD family protein [Bacillota bacterium]
MDKLFSPQVIWVTLIIVFIIIEAVSLGLVSIWFAFGALIALISSYFIDSIIIQITLFVFASVILLYFTKPIVQKYLKAGRERTNVDSLIDEKGLVVKDIKKHQTGHVKVKGQIWTAYSDEDIDNGVEIVIEKVEGVKLKVRKDDK